MVAIDDAWNVYVTKGQNDLKYSPKQSFTVCAVIDREPEQDRVKTIRCQSHGISRHLVDW